MIVLGILISLILLMFIFSKIILWIIFGKRCEGNPNLKYYTANDFEGLNAKKVEFKSNKGQILRGNIYTHNEVKEYKGLIVFVHGMGGGHLSYTTEINTLAKAGYIVLGYDNTGTCASEGKNLKGFFQAVIDLKYALQYVSNEENLKKYKVILVGHSWGAYSVCQVLQYKPSVEAVVALSGPNDSAKLFGDFLKIQIFKPFFWILNYCTFGKDSVKTTAKVLSKTNVPVLVLQGKEDATLKFENSLASSECAKILDEKANIEIIIYEGKYHNVYQTRESEKYLNETFAKISELNKKKAPIEEANKVYDAIDYKKITEEDEEVMTTMIKFIDRNIK